MHILLFISFFTYIYALVWCYFYIIFYSLLCPLSGPDLTYISLLIIPCIIYYVTNKETLRNLDLDLKICLLGAWLVSSQGLEPTLDSWSGAEACTRPLVRGWSLHWTLGQGLEPALDPWSGAGACTGLLVRGWSLHWTLGQGLEPALDSWSGAEARTGPLVRGWSLHWTLGQDTAANFGAEVSRSRQAWHRSGRRDWDAHSQWDGQMNGRQTWLRIDRQAWVSRGRRAWLRSGWWTWLTSGQRRSRWTPMANFSKLGQNDVWRFPCRKKIKNKSENNFFFKTRKTKLRECAPLTVLV